MVIIGIIGVVAWLRWRQMVHGETFSSQLAMISPLTWSWLASLAGLLVGGFVVTRVVAAALGARAVSVARKGHAVEVRLRAPETLLGGLLAIAAGATCLGFGVVGEGWAWKLVLAAGLVVVGFGAIAAGVQRRWVREGPTLRSESTWFGSVRETKRAEVAAAARPTVEPYRTGGAFGQPVVEGFRVLLDNQLVLETSDQRRAEAVAAGLRGDTNSSVDSGG